MPVSVAKPIDVPFPGCLRLSHRSPVFISVRATIDVRKCAFVYLPVCGQNGVGVGDVEMRELLNAK